MAPTAPSETPGVEPPAPNKNVEPQVQAPPEPDAEASAVTRRALLIGVGQASFRGVAQLPLPQCVIDAKTLAATLRPRGFSCDVLTDGEGVQPTAANIRAQVTASAAVAGENDLLLVYISTHGDVIDGKSVVIGKDDMVEIDWVKRQLAASRAAVKILMLDCCRNDKGFERTATEVRDVQCIMACRPEQLSKVGQSGMSVFTEAMVDGLVECHADRVKDGKIELDELMYFLEREVPARARKVDKDAAQNPTRTVVDPKVVTPIFAECTLHDQLTFGPASYANTPPAAARTSLLLSDLTLLRVQPGMTVDEARQAIGAEWTEAPVIGADGTGVGLLVGKPDAKDVIVIRFKDSKVHVAHILYQELCKEDYSPLKVRGALRNLIGEGALVDLTPHLEKLSPAQIIAKLGCADSALLPTGQFTDQVGELRYPQVPRPAQMLVIRVKGGVFDSVQLVPIE